MGEPNRFEAIRDERPNDAPWPGMTWPPTVARLTGRVVELSHCVPERDASPLFHALNHDAVWRHVPGRPNSPEQYTSTLAKRRAEGLFVWIVRLLQPHAGLAAGAIIGTSSYLDVCTRDARLEIGATVYVPAVWGTKVNPDAKLLLLAHAFETLGAGRVQLKTDIRNERSQKAIARLGARWEGTLRRFQRRDDSTVRDTVLFSIIAEDWPDVRERLIVRLTEAGQGCPISPAPAALADGGRYTFANVDPQLELERLRRIEAIFDPTSRRLLDAGGLAPDMRCLEIGAGAGSIALWLAERAGHQGEVVAVDLDASFLRASLPKSSGVRVVEGDARQVLASSRFDLVHLRYVLIHNVDWETLLDAAVASLKPGAALVVEEPDFTAAKAALGADAGAFDRVNAAICAMFRGAAKDPSLGLRLPAALEQRGLRVERAENAAPLCRGSEPVATMMAMSTRQLRGKYLATGIVRDGDLDGYLRFAANPTSWGVYYATVSVLARKGASQ